MLFLFCVCIVVVVVVCVYFLQFLPAHAHSCWIIGLYSASSVDAPPITAHRTHTHTYSNSHTQTQRQTKASKATSTTTATATATRRIIVLPKERAFNVCDTLYHTSLRPPIVTATNCKSEKDRQLEQRR